MHNECRGRNVLINTLTDFKVQFYEDDARNDLTQTADNSANFLYYSLKEGRFFYGV